LQGNLHTFFWKTIISIFPYMSLLSFCNNYSFIIIQYKSQYLEIHTQKATLKRKQQKEIIVNNDDQYEPNLRRSKRHKTNKQAVQLKSTPACNKKQNIKSITKELSKQRQVSNKSIILIILIILILVILIVLIFC
jgi:ATP-dependent Zn protease